jgi:hypothetical protein
VAQSGTAQAWKILLDSLFPQGYPGSKEPFGLGFFEASQNPRENARKAYFALLNLPK